MRVQYEGMVLRIGPTVSASHLSSLLTLPPYWEGGMMRACLQGKCCFTSMHQWLQIVSELVISSLLASLKGE